MLIKWCTKTYKIFFGTKRIKYEGFHVNFLLYLLFLLFCGKTSFQKRLPFFSFGSRKFNFKPQRERKTIRKLLNVKCFYLWCSLHWAASSVSVPSDAAGGSQQGAVQQRPVSAAWTGSAAGVAPSPHALLLRVPPPPLTKHIHSLKHAAFLFAHKGAPHCSTLEKRAAKMMHGL